MKNSMQLKALVRNLSKSSNINAEIILRNFMLERFLERVSLSNYKNNFILKGGMLVAAMVGIDSRSTMDMDATIKGYSVSEIELRKIIAEILSVKLSDNVIFELSSIEEIREEADYLGFRVSINSQFDKTKQTLKIDITTGDILTPKEINYSFNLMFEDRKIDILAYNIETVLAEKFETIISRSVANTRMRDFYDIYILINTQEFDKAIYISALKNTSKNRGTENSLNNINDILEAIETSNALEYHWINYQNKYSYSKDITWDMVCKSINDIALLIKNK